MHSSSVVDAAPCDLVARDAFAFVDDALGASDRASIEAHAAHCPACRSRIAHARRLLRVLRRSAHAVTAPRTLRRRAETLLSAWRSGGTLAPRE